MVLGSVTKLNCLNSVQKTNQKRYGLDHKEGLFISGEVGEG
jgi:hypothetical protein